jgi:hypothetical protein
MFATEFSNRRFGYVFKPAAATPSLFHIGFENQDDGRDVWMLCHELYLKYGVINEAPSSWSDLKTVYDIDSAVTILKNKLELMSKYRISLSVSYDKAKSYHIFQHLMFTLPHQTNNLPCECVIEGIEKDKDNGKVNLDLMFLDESTISVLLNKWQDTYDNNNNNIKYQYVYDISQIKIQETY